MNRRNVYHEGHEEHEEGFAAKSDLSLVTASGGKVCHLESSLRMRFAPRSSDQITSAFETEFVQ